MGMAIEIRERRSERQPREEGAPALASSDERKLPLDRPEPAPMRLANSDAPLGPLASLRKPVLLTPDAKKTFTPPRQIAPHAVETIVDAKLGSATREELQTSALTIAAAQQPDGSWGAHHGETALDASVMHHLATVALLRSGELAPEAQVQLEATLAASWVHLTGKFRAPEKMMEPLPWLSTMRHTERATGAMHSAVFGDSRDELYAALRALNQAPSARDFTRVIDALGTLTSRLDGSDDALRLQTVVTEVLQRAANPSAQFAAGLLVSYAIASLTESFSHDKIHHATPEVRAKWKRMGKIGEILKRSYLSHSGVHHGATFKKDYVTQFASDEERARLTAKMVKSGNRRVVDDNFGLTISSLGVLRFLVPATPAYAAAVSGAIALDAHPLTYAAMVGPALLMPLASKVLHPYLHMTREAAMDKAGPTMRWFLDTALARYISRHHFVHHMRENEDVNFNLVPGGDILRGKSRAPNSDELAQMHALRMIH